MRSKGFLILQQKCSTKFLNLLKLTLSKELNVQRTLFYRTKGSKTQQKCQMRSSEVVEAHFSSREAQCRWGKVHGAVSSSANNAELGQAHPVAL